MSKLTDYVKNEFEVKGRQYGAGSAIGDKIGGIGGAALGFALHMELGPRVHNIFSNLNRYCPAGLKKRPELRQNHRRCAQSAA